MKIRMSARENLEDLSNLEEKVNEDIHTLMNRVENKYFIDRKYLKKIETELSHRFVLGDIDTDTRHTRNRTIYLDNKELTLFRDCIDKKIPRTKIRIRQYSPDDKGWEKVAYAEFKLKEEDLTKKIRVRIPDTLIEELSNGGRITFDENLVNINKDIGRDLLRARVKSFNKIIKEKDLKKIIEVQYERRAYSGKNIRITIDENLEFLDAKSINSTTQRTIEKMEGWEEFVKPYIVAANEKPLIVEVKTDKDSYPSWLKNLLKNIEAEESAFSKYAASIITHMKSEKEKGDVFVKVFRVDEFEKKSNQQGRIKMSQRDGWMLYLDDKRTPSDVQEWIVAKTVQHAKNLVMYMGIPSFISFDHDIDENGTGYDFAKWLVEQDQDGKYEFPDNFRYQVHSANPVGAQNIKGLLDSYLQHKKEEKEIHGNGL